MTDPSNPVKVDIEELLTQECPTFAEMSEGISDAERAELEAADPETAALLKSLESEIADNLTGQPRNPLEGEDIPTLIRVYLDNSTFGIRWVVTQATVKLKAANPKAKPVSRKALARFLDGNDESLSADEVSAVIDVVLDDHKKSTKPVAPRATLPTAPVSKLNRKSRRAKQRSERGNTPVFQHYDDAGFVPDV